MSNIFSNIFGGKPKFKQIVQKPTVDRRIVEQPEETKQDILRRYAKLHKATMVSNLTQPGIKRRTLGAG